VVNGLPQPSGWVMVGLGSHRPRVRVRLGSHGPSGVVRVRSHRPSSRVVGALGWGGRSFIFLNLIFYSNKLNNKVYI
jgi:hypothetical protein